MDRESFAVVSEKSNSSSEELKGSIESLTRAKIKDKDPKVKEMC